MSQTVKEHPISHWNNPIKRSYSRVFSGLFFQVFLSRPLPLWPCGAPCSTVLACQCCQQFFSTCSQSSSTFFSDNLFFGYHPLLTKNVWYPNRFIPGQLLATIRSCDPLNNRQHQVDRIPITTRKIASNFQHTLWGRRAVAISPEDANLPGNLTPAHNDGWRSDAVCLNVNWATQSQQPRHINLIRSASICSHSTELTVCLITSLIFTTRRPERLWNRYCYPKSTADTCLWALGDMGPLRTQTGPVRCDFQFNNCLCLSVKLLTKNLTGFGFLSLILSVIYTAVRYTLLTHGIYLRHTENCTIYLLTIN